MAPRPKLPAVNTLLPEDQVLANLRDEIAKSTLKDVAARYRILPQQLSDALHGRANLSRRMAERLKLRMFKFYQKV